MGGTSSTVVWPTGSIPSNFTVCSVTRYVVGGIMNRILVGTPIDWYHGHWNSKRGQAWYGVWNTNHKISVVGVLTDWLVMCGKNGGSIPNNILVDGNAVGISNAGVVATSSLCINFYVSFSGENSDWAFRELMIWNTSLSDAEMVVASTALRISLNEGTIMFVSFS